MNKKMQSVNLKVFKHANHPRNMINIKILLKIPTLLCVDVIPYYALELRRRNIFCLFSEISTILYIFFFK